MKLRVTRSDYRAYGLPAAAVLYVHRDGTPVDRTETTTLAARLRLACGVQLASRWGSAQLLWRGGR